MPYSLRSQLGVTKPEDPQKKTITDIQKMKPSEKKASGGVFTELAKAVENAGGIIIWLIMTRRKTSPSRQRDLEKLRRSKYVESFMADTMKEISEALVAEKRCCSAEPPVRRPGSDMPFEEVKISILLILYVTECLL